MSTLFYRNASLEDLDKIVEIYNSTVHSRMVTADTEPVTIESRLHWFHEHNPKTRPLWVVEDENSDIVGWVSFQSFYGQPSQQRLRNCHWVRPSMGAVKLATRPINK
eukprot:Opistho-1_new@84133